MISQPRLLGQKNIMAAGSQVAVLSHSRLKTNRGGKYCIPGLSYASCDLIPLAEFSKFPELPQIA